MARHPVTFIFLPEYYDGEIKTVGILGNFLFYKSNLTGSTCETGMADNKDYFNPHQFEDGMEQTGMRYYEEMQKNADGSYSITFELPEGTYGYRFAVNAVIENEIPDFRSGKQMAVCGDGQMHGLSRETVYLTDPKNPPRVTSVSGRQDDSILAVGTWETYPWLPGVPEEKKGTVSYMSYTDVDGMPQTIGVYLPAGYSREKTYPVVFVSHGGGGNEGDWYHQGSINTIMDSLIARGETAEAILVTMNNSVYSWNYEKIAANLYNCIIPFVRTLFPASAEVEKNAFCGLSMGSMTTLYMYMNHNKAFKYFGAFSGGFAGGEGFTLDDPALFEKQLFIGCGEEDIAWNEREIGIPPTLRALKAKGVPFTEFFTPGGHDWYCWPQMFSEFAKNILWK